MTWSLVRVTGLKPAASWSQTKRSINWATPGYTWRLQFCILNYASQYGGTSPHYNRRIYSSHEWWITSPPVIGWRNLRWLCEAQVFLTRSVYRPRHIAADTVMGICVQSTYHVWDIIILANSKVHEYNDHNRRSNSTLQSASTDLY